MSEESAVSFTAAAQLMELLTELSADKPCPDKDRRLEYEYHHTPFRPSTTSKPEFRWSENALSRHAKNRVPTGNEREAFLTPPPQPSFYTFPQPVILSLPNRRNRGRSNCLSRPPCPDFGEPPPEKKASTTTFSTRPDADGKAHAREYGTRSRPTLSRSSSMPNPTLQVNAVKKGKVSSSTRLHPTSFTVLARRTKPPPHPLFEDESDSARRTRFRSQKHHPYDSDPSTHPSTADASGFTLRDIVPLSPTSTLCSRSRCSTGRRSASTVIVAEQRSKEKRYTTPPNSSIAVDKTNQGARCTSMSAVESTDETVDDDDGGASSIFAMYFDQNANKSYVEPTPGRLARPTSDAIKGGWKRRWKWLTKAWEKQKETKHCNPTLKYNASDERKREGRLRQR